MDSRLAKALYDAFLTGRDAKRPEAADAPGRLFASLLNAEMYRRIPQTEGAIVESCWAIQYQALVAARSRRLEQCRAGLANVHSVLDGSCLSHEASLLVRVLLEPAQAYLDYVNEDYGRASERVRSASEINHRLSEEYGYGILSAQRLQLCHNLLRIKSRQGRRNEAIVLASAFLDYLERGDRDLPDEIAWAWVSRSAIPESVIDYYFDHICGEAAIASAGQVDPALFVSLADHVDSGTCQHGFATHAHRWITSKKLMIDGEWKSYLEEACQLLQIGRTSEPSIWFATIIDVVFVCGSLGAAGVAVADRISKDAAGIPEAPWLLRQKGTG
jgi:hypothetical protein